MAITGLDVAALVGPTEPAARAVAAEAREILVELGATPVVTRLDRLIPPAWLPAQPASSHAQPDRASTTERPASTPIG